MAMVATAPRTTPVTEKEEKETREEKAIKEEREAKEGVATLACLRPIAPPKAAPITMAMAATAERRPAVTEREEKATREEREEAGANVVRLRAIATPTTAPTTKAMAATAPRTTPEKEGKVTKEVREKVTKEVREKEARAKDATSNGLRDDAITTPAAPTTTGSAVSATNQATMEMEKSLLCTDATFDASQLLLRMHSDYPSFFFSN